MRQICLQEILLSAAYNDSNGERWRIQKWRRTDAATWVLKEMVEILIRTERKQPLSETTQQCPHSSYLDCFVNRILY